MFMFKQIQYNSFHILTRGKYFNRNTRSYVNVDMGDREKEVLCITLISSLRSATVIAQPLWTKVKLLSSVW